MRGSFSPRHHVSEGLAELKEHRSEVEALQADIDEGAAGKRQGRQGTRPAMRQVDNEVVMQATRQSGRRPGRRAMMQTYM